MEKELKQKKDTNQFNQIFVVILYLRAIISFIEIVSGTAYFFTNPEQIYVANIFAVLTGVVALVGAIYFLKRERIGFYLTLMSLIMTPIVIFWQYSIIFDGVFSEQVIKEVLLSTSHIGILFLWMLLKKNGRNVYQVLWPKQELD